MRIYGEEVEVASADSPCKKFTRKEMEKNRLRAGED